MLWDLGLLAILISNILRSAQRGGRAVGVELASFAMTYLATLALAPGLARFIEQHAIKPPPFLSLLCVVIVYFSLRRTIKRLASWWLPEPRPWQWPTEAEARRSRSRGACLGFVRGVIVVLALALIGSSLSRLQSIGMLQALPPMTESRAIESSTGLIDLLVYRYTREAGPTTRQLIDLTLEPDEDRLTAFLETPFVERMKTSDEMIAFAKNPEVRRLIKEHQMLSVVTHPTFLRVVSLAFTELRNETTVIAQI